MIGEPVYDLSSYWSRDGSIKIDVMARIGEKRFLVGECKWREEKPVGPEVLGDLKRKLALTGRDEWQRNAQYLIAGSSGFTRELLSVRDVILIGPKQL